MPKTLYPYQSECIDAIYRYYSDGGKGNIVCALPTGTGKGTLIAELTRRIMSEFPNQRIMMLTHVKTLITQNFLDLKEQWPDAPAGIYSAGLKRKEYVRPIVFGGVQSVVKCPERFGHRDLLLVDECHLISPKGETSYQSVIGKLKQINPALKVWGFSATPYRLGQGLLTEDGIFDDCPFDITSLEKFNKLLEDGYLVPPVPKRTGTEIDLSSVGTRNGQYIDAELDAASNTSDLNQKVCREMIQMASDRRSWLVFCASIDHANKINNILRSLGVDSDCVHSERSSEHNERTIRNWKEGRLRCIVNKDMLTTGVNNKACDFIGMLRGTTSASLWVQMLGRGTRTSPETSKTNCLVADFVGNTKRLGPINDPVVPRKPRKGKSTGGLPPIRICDECGVYNHANARICIGCGFEFPLNSNLTPYASEAELIRTEAPIINEFDVSHVVYHRHQKNGSPPVIRASYHCGRLGLTKFDQWVMFEHSGYPKKKAHDWWRERADTPPPATTDEALKLIPTLKKPNKIKVIVNKTYPEILTCTFAEADVNADHSL